MISAYFTAMTCEAKGPRTLIRSRLLRLGLPVLVWSLLMIPLQVFVFAPPDKPGLAAAWPIDVGHLWFLEHLLLFSVGYALWRMARPARAAAQRAQANPPGYLTILLFCLALAVVSAVVRIWSPIDQWNYYLGFFRVAFADVPRDLSFFVIGLVVYHQGWLRTFPTKAGKVWLAVGLVAAALWYAYALGLYQVLPIGDLAMGVIYPIWEALLCCGMCIGLTVLFREKLDVQTPLTQALAQGQYTAYIIHVPVVLLFQYPVLGLAWTSLAKFVLVTLLSVAGTFLLSHWLRKPLHL